MATHCAPLAPIMTLLEVYQAVSTCPLPLHMVLPGLQPRVGFPPKEDT